jgi:hypothetical protein
MFPFALQHTGKGFTGIVALCGRGITTIGSTAVKFINIAVDACTAKNVGLSFFADGLATGNPGKHFVFHCCIVIDE